MGRWTKGKTLSVNEVRMKNGLVHGTIDCLTEGSEYMFRIKAVNKGGPSEPSDPSDSMIAKIRFSKTQSTPVETPSLKVHACLTSFSEAIFASARNVRHRDKEGPHVPLRLVVRR